MRSSEALRSSNEVPPDLRVECEAQPQFAPLAGGGGGGGGVNAITSVSLVLLGSLKWSCVLIKATASTASFAAYLVSAVRVSCIWRIGIVPLPLPQLRLMCAVDISMAINWLWQIAMKCSVSASCSSTLRYSLHPRLTDTFVLCHAFKLREKYNVPASLGNQLWRLAASTARQCLPAKSNTFCLHGANLATIAMKRRKKKNCCCCCCCHSMADMQSRCCRMSLHAADVSQFGLSSKLLSQHAY